MAKKNKETNDIEKTKEIIKEILKSKDFIIKSTEGIELSEKSKKEIIEDLVE